MNIKRLVVPFLLGCLALTMFLGTVKIGHATTLTVDRTFTSETDDGHLARDETSYGSARNASTGEWKHDDHVSVGQLYGGGQYKVSRGAVYFVTSMIPDNATLLNATLSLYVEANLNTTTFNITIQTGNNTYPSEPLELADFNYAFYSGNGGTRNISTIIEFQYWNITLSSEGLSWINLASITKFWLVSSKDIANIAPTDAEEVQFAAAEKGSALVPKLYVTYEIEGFRYIVHGPYYENGQVANCITNVTLYSKTNNPYSFVLNGSDGVADTATIENDTASWYFQWNASTTNSRSYYLKTDMFEEFWLYVADPTKTYAAYTVSFLDLAGVLKTMPHVKAERYINGIKIVERATVDIEKKVIFYMEAYASYSITIEDDTVTYAFGDLIFGSSTSITLTIKAVDFPKATLFTYKYVRVYGERALGTPNGTITIMYQDTLNKTTSVQIWINYRNLTNIATTTITTNSSFVYTWSSASNDTDYAVALGITHETYGYYGWKQYFPRGMSEMPWGMAWFGTLPFNTAYILPAMLIVFAGACFSVVNAYVGAFMMVIMAVLESYIGWLPIPASVIVVAFTFAIIMAIIYAKRKIQS